MLSGVCNTGTLPRRKCPGHVFGLAGNPIFVCYSRIALHISNPHPVPKTSLNSHRDKDQTRPDQKSKKRCTSAYR